MSTLNRVGIDRATDERAALRSPQGERLTRPRWRDPRLILGVVLVLVAVLLGARVLAGAQRGTAVLVASRPVAAGHSIEAGDLQVRTIHLSGVASRYWSAGDLAGLTGHPVLTAIAAGDLVPRSAVADTAAVEPMRTVSLPIDPARMPVLQRGDRVDVFATYPPVTGGADTQPGRTIAVIRGAEYVGGSDTGSGTTVAVRLRVAVRAAAGLVRASQVAKLDVALQNPAGDDTGDVGIAPVLDPTRSP